VENVVTVEKVKVEDKEEEVGVGVEFILGVEAGLDEGSGLLGWGTAALDPWADPALPVLVPVSEPEPPSLVEVFPAPPPLEIPLPPATWPPLLAPTGQ
jgi:hypothetical protein